MEIIQNRKKNLTLVIVCVVVALVAGLSLVFITITNAKRSIYSSTDNHLADMANIFDSNVNGAKIRCNSELDSIIGSEIIITLEDAYVNQGDFSHLQNKLRDTNVLDSGYAYDILVKTDNAILSAKDYDISHLDFSRENDNGSFWMGTDNECGTAYLMVSKVSRNNSEITYILVIEFNKFYKRVTINTYLEEYWAILYDSSNDLVIQSSNVGADYLVIDKESIMARNDGYSKILQCEEDASEQVATYSIVYEGEQKNARMYVKPCFVNLNGLFSIGVAVFQDEIDNVVKSWSIGLFIASMLIAGSIAFLAFYVLHSGERERELASEIKALEEEKDIITKAKEAQEALYHHKRLETIGTMTAGIAHEFNNMLSPIMADSLLALEKVSEDDVDVYDNLVDIYNSSRKAKELISKISRLSRKNPEIGKKILSPEDLIDGTVSIVATSIPKNTHIETNIETHSTIMGNESQLAYMFVNIILNASQAMEPNGGIIVVTVKDDGEYVAFTIEDEGPGIPDDQMSLIFDPFYTTKAAGKGTGLGLSITASTVSDHEGKIEVQNREGGGARFTVFLKACKTDMD